MMDGLKDAHREAITAVIAANDRVERAVLFGSRATGTNTVSSDVDIALFGSQLTLTDQARLAVALDEIPMAQSVDLLLYDSIRDRTLKEHIRRQGVGLYARQPLKEASDTTWGSPRPFDCLPLGWERSTLGAVCERGGGNIQTGPFGSQLHASDYRPVGVPSIMPQNLGDNRVIEEGIARIGERDACRLARYLVRKGDIVYSRRGDVERRALIASREDGWLCGTGCLRVRLGQNGVDPQYASYYLGAPVVREWIVRHAHGATMPNLNTAILSACPFLVPPVSEQRTIAHILGTLDDKIELNRRMNATLEAMARALFRSWFVDFDPVRAKMEGRDTGLPKEIADLFPDRMVYSELGEIPEGWSTWCLQELAEHHAQTITPSSDPGAEFDLFSIPAYDAGQLPDRVLGETVRSNKAIVPPNAVLLSKLNPAIPRVWMPEKSSGRLQVCSTEFLVFTPRRPATRSLLFSVFTDMGFRDMLQSMATGTSGSHQRVPVKGLKPRKVLAGSGTLVSAFGDLLTPVLARTIDVRAESRTLAALRDALLPKLVSGELRGFGPASVRDERPVSVGTSGT